LLNTTRVKKKATAATRAILQMRISMVGNREHKACRCLEADREEGKGTGKMEEGRGKSAKR
jgi:hypothetical protein